MHEPQSLQSAQVFTRVLAIDVFFSDLHSQVPLYIPHAHGSIFLCSCSLLAAKHQWFHQQSPHLQTCINSLQSQLYKKHFAIFACIN